VKAPTLDDRKFVDLLRQVTQLAEESAPEWWARVPDDLGMVLAAIYAHNLEVLLARLNRVPEKNLLAFLDLIGVGRLPPGTAQAPIVFSLAPTAGASGFVPQGTQVATVQTETQPAVIYETQQDLNVVAAQLSTSYIIEPAKDRFSDRTLAVTGQEQAVFPPFQGDRPIDHLLYVGGDPLLLMQRPGQLILTFQLAAALNAAKLQELFQAVKWQVSKGGDWPLPAPKFGLVGADPVSAFTLTFDGFPGAEVTTLSGPGLAAPLSNRWLRGQLDQPISGFPIATSLKANTLSATINQLAETGGSGLLPDQAHTNTTPLDFTKEFYPLGQNPQVGDTFYLASTEAFAKTAAGVSDQVIIDLGVRGADAKLTWHYWRKEGKWGRLEVDDQTGSFSEDGKISFRLPGDAELISLPGQQETPRVFLLRASIETGSYHRAPAIRRFQVELTNTSGQTVTAVPIGFASDYPVANPVLPNGSLNRDLVGLDLNDVFLPFGPLPNAGQTFYFTLPPNTQPNSQVTASVQLTPPPRVTLAWEYLGQNGWTPLTVNDNTGNLTRPGQINFTRPANFAPGEVNGQRNYWLRARLVGGYYGRPMEFVPVTPADPSKGFKPRPGSGALNAPLISSIRLFYSAQNQSPPVVTQNLFSLVQPTAGGYQPFVPVAETEPTFYLGFDRKLPNSAVNLYFVAPPRQFVEKILLLPGPEEMRAELPEEVAAEPKLTWEYWSGSQWAELAVVDETKRLTESGVVQFIGPADLVELAKFEPTPRYWIRTRQVAGGVEYAPWLSGVFLNAVQVVQATTIQNELLGSSNGRKNQVFRFSKSPVLPGQRLLVREPERPPAEEANQIKAEEGQDAVQIKETESGAEEVWVRWREVKSLNLSGPRSRHYTLERITGEIRFGDGVHGLVPPEARDNLVGEAYRAGGGPEGNQPAGAISQLKSSIPYIAAVSNPLPADGGSAAETLLAAQERGPQTLRHRGRAVTAADFEWLARQAASTRVARAKCLPNRNRELDFEPGWATLIIVPGGKEKKLLPSVELIRAVEDDLATRSLATLTGLTPTRINVIGPGYVPVEIRAEVVPVSLAQADVVRQAVLVALDRFLHPLTGGPDGEGWAFGRDVYLSELYAAFEALPGVEHVRSLSFKPTVATLPLKFLGAAAATYPAGTALTVNMAQGVLQARLVEPLAAGASAAMVVLFREGERVKLTPKNEDDGLPIETTVRSISGSTLLVDPFPVRQPGAVGSPVISVDGAAASFLTIGLAPGTLVNSLTVQGFAPGQMVTSSDYPSLSLQVAGDGANQQLELGQRLRVPEFYLVYSGAHTASVAL
jgi:hypothetical protein